MTLLAAAQHLALDLGWPVMPVKPRGKEPLTVHGVKDATTDERTLLHWWDKWPDANIGIATGAPGPTVLDIDNLEAARFLLATLEAAGPPEAATARGRHLYYAGTMNGTIALGYGELRSRGSYVVAPPSVHPSGKDYAWLVEPTGRRLPPVPDDVANGAKPAGVGEMPIVERVEHGGRHDHLKNLAVHLVRGGMTYPPAIARALQAEYDAVCDHNPPARPDEFKKLAEWATTTRIATRERARADGAPQGALTAPIRGATLLEHRQHLDHAGGWAPQTIVRVRRYGNRLVDALHIHLDDGSLIDFARQGDITVRGHWSRTVIAGTHGAAAPPALKDHELTAVYRSLCTLAGKSPAELEAGEHLDVFGDLLALCQPLTGHTADTSPNRYRLIAAVKAHPAWDPMDRQSPVAPLLIVDAATDQRYLRAGDLMNYFRYRGAGINTREFLGRMQMIGLTQVRLNGREPRTVELEGPRATNTALFYLLPVPDDGGDGE